MERKEYTGYRDDGVATMGVRVTFDSLAPMPESTPSNYGGYWPPRDRKGQWVAGLDYSALADDLVGESNYHVAVDILSELPECDALELGTFGDKVHHADDGPCWEEQRYSSWAYAHYDRIWFRVDCPNVGPVALEIADALEDYPLLDEQDHSEREHAEIVELVEEWPAHWQSAILDAAYGTGTDHDGIWSLVDRLNSVLRQWDPEENGPENVDAAIAHVFDNEPLPRIIVRGDLEDLLADLERATFNGDDGTLEAIRGLREIINPEQIVFHGTILQSA